MLDDRGDPVEGASVRVVAGSASEQQPAAVTDRLGHFVLPTVPEGTRSLVADHRGRARSDPQEVRVLRGTEVRGVRLRLSVLTGEPAAAASTLSLTRALNGYRVDRVEDDSAEARAGIQAGDTIVSVDGREPRDVPDALARLAGLGGSVVIVDLEREGQRRVVRLSIVGRR